MNLKIRINDRIYSVKVGNLKTSPILVDVEGEAFEVWPDQSVAVPWSQDTDQLPVNSLDPVRLPQSDKLTNRLDFTTNTIADSDDQDSARFMSIRAPIPGIITAIYVYEGSKIEVGQELLKLEAMKMNNSIRANRSGIIRIVHVSVGQAVKLNQVLLDYA